MNPLWNVHTASVETYTGPGETGDTYAAAVNVLGFFDDGLMLDQHSPTGDVVEGVSVFFAGLADYAKFVPQSRVTIGGRAMQVVTVKRRQAGGPFMPVEHVEVRLK